MIAKLKPLKGKYYGTKITVTEHTEDPHNPIEAHIEIWDSGDGTPSKRELEMYGYTEEQWENNSLIYDGWGKSPIREVIVCDSHFESKQTYGLALKIVEKLNG